MGNVREFRSSVQGYQGEVERFDVTLRDSSGVLSNR